MFTPKVIPSEVINFWEINTGVLKAMFCNQVGCSCLDPGCVPALEWRKYGDRYFTRTVQMAVLPL